MKNFNQKKHFYGNGKLLISGEYLVLDGALSLAVPCKLGQSLTVANREQNLIWESFDHEKKRWFNLELDSSFTIILTNDSEKAQVLVSILQTVCELNSGFAKELFQSHVTTQLTFHKEWGLGTSSTLIYCLSEWAKVNPYTLLSTTFGGSGYDLACANAQGAITFQLANKTPNIQPVDFNPAFTENIYFAYLGKKQISKSEIAKYSLLQFNRSAAVNQISLITQKLITSATQDEFCHLLQQHEVILSSILGVPTIAEKFPTIQGTFKSLGGWGGDFIMFIGCQKEADKLRNLNLGVVFTWKQLILNS